MLKILALTVVLFTLLLYFGYSPVVGKGERARFITK